jgi:hypothetical protein
MHTKIEEIKKNESAPKVIKNLFNKKEIEKFLNLYNELPTTVHNKKQNVIKKRWLKEYGKELENIFYERLKNEIGDFKYDNLKTDNGEDLIYKQSLIPLTPVGSTVIFKNRFYGQSTNFTIDKSELNIKKLNYGQNKRSNEHIGMFGNKKFNPDDHKKFLNHEKIENLVGLEIELVYEWELGSMLIFDRTNLHCSSSKIEGKKIGLTTFTKR